MSKSKNNYVGFKGGQTILPKLMSHVPDSKRYFSFFFGSGGLELSQSFNDTSWIIAEKDQALRLKASTMDHVVYNDYQDIVANFDFTSDDFVFCDPPYLLNTRKSGRKYYKNEFNLEDHKKFLNIIKNCKAKVMITHPFCDLYDSFLTDWYKIDFTYMSQSGWFEDGIYLNYLSCSVALKSYKYLGCDRTERQMIKRKRENFCKKFESLSYHEKLAFLKQINCRFI